MRAVLFLVVLVPCFAIAVNMTPRFNNSHEHVTVTEGERVILPCSVDVAGKETVIWVNPRKTLISLEDRRLIDDHRISVERPYIKIWNLLIRDVRYNDSGTYECKVNTTPRMVKKVTLEVQVPPAILSQLSSDRVTLEEGESATLVCNVTGIPQPNVTWYKRNHREIVPVKERIGLEGEVLIIHNVTRHCDDIYECFVDNGVPPSVSKAIRVVVNYPPEVVLPNPKRIGQRLGKETILECQIYAHPHGITAWKKDGQTLERGQKYDIEVFKNDVENSITLTLRISNLRKGDYGNYECFGSNFLGEAHGFFMLYEVKPPPTTTTRATTTVRRVSMGPMEPGLVIGDRRPSTTNDKNSLQGYSNKGNGGNGGYEGCNGDSQKCDNRQADPATYPLNSPRSGQQASEDDEENKTWMVFNDDENSAGIPV
ncbi:opioid-binding protein/cell adhesion molecule homolog, partial [Aplysia californica]|uniref:Opioid-binding protein/cell adhesion molecule homolog n=1 Tax=Aplysia californica TaxID=6500 RepID=A0ABM1VRV1_APLCA